MAVVWPTDQPYARLVERALRSLNAGRSRLDAVVEATRARLRAEMLENEAERERLYKAVYEDPIWLNDIVP